jgi:hypothetical protein
MLFYYCFKNFILEMVSNQRSRTTWKEAKWTATRGEKEERDYEGKVHKKQEIYEPYTCFS